MKLILIILMSFCSEALIANDDCPNAQEKIIKDVKNISLKSDYIEILARQIFTDETALTNFIGIRCFHHLQITESISGIVK